MHRLAATTLLCAASTLTLTPHATTQPPADPAWQPHRQLAVLYAGFPDGTREAAFTEFLTRWFDHTVSIPLAELSAESASEFDVVIVDWTSRYGNDGYSGSPPEVPVVLGPEFTKPIIAMSYTGPRVRKEYKVEWL